MARKTIVIIGGGPAGLTAAYELLKNNVSEQFDVTVLEASANLAVFLARFAIMATEWILAGIGSFPKMTV